MSEKLNDVKEYLLSHDDYIIFAHANPDADTLGSAGTLANVLQYFGKKAKAFCPDNIPQRLMYLTDENEFAFDLTPADLQGKTLISTDIASYPMLGKYEEYFTKGELKFELSIDHHDVNTLRTERMCVYPDYISNGEIIYELSLLMGYVFDKKSATMLFSAICSDSGGFKYQSTRPETYEYAAQLIRAGADFNEIFKQLFERKTMSQFLLEKKAYENISFHFGGKVCVLYITADMIENSGADSNDIDSLNQIPRMFEGVEVSAVIKPHEIGSKVSLRSNSDFDVASLAKSFGGGGHYHAAGFRYKGSENEVKEILLKELCKYF